MSDFEPIFRPLPPEVTVKQFTKDSTEKIIGSWKNATSIIYLSVYFFEHG